MAGVEGVITCEPTCRARTASACSCTTSRSWRATRCAMSAKRWRRSRPRTRSRHAARCQKIKVVYEPLPARVRSRRGDAPGRAGAARLCARQRHQAHPDPRRRRRDGLCRIPTWWSTETYATQQVEHAYLEPEAGLAYVDHDGVVTIVSPSQNITHHRHMLAKIIAQPINKVRFIMSPVGGGFGGKEDMIFQGMLAVMAMKTRMPVRYVFTREESIIATAKRHPSRTTLKMGLGRDGRIRAVEFRMIADGGAYGLSTEGVDAQGRDPRRRALQHPAPADGHLRRLHQQHAVRRVPLVRRAADAVRDRIPPRYLRREARPRPVRNPPHQCDARRRHDAYQADAALGQLPAHARRGRAGVRLGKGRAGLAWRHARRSRWRRRTARPARSARASRKAPTTSASEVA